MRVDFCKSIYQVLDRDPLSMLITGDLGFKTFDEFPAAHGKRFLNAGVAEQNMMGMAAGLALSGLRPWVYSIVPFVTYRCLEQIRNDVCFHNLPVRIVGNGGGYTYGVLGSTHHALEDLGVLKTLPNMVLFFPCANDQVATAVEAIDRCRMPTYLRLAVSPFTTARSPLSEHPQTLTRHYQRGSALTILGIGHAVQIALAALERFGLAEMPVDVFGIARYPFDLTADWAILESVRRSGRVLVIEEHYQPGGMGESLKAALPGTRSFDTMAAVYSKEPLYGSSAFHLQQCRLTPEHLRQRVMDLLGASPN